MTVTRYRCGCVLPCPRDTLTAPGTVRRCALVAHYWPMAAEDWHAWTAFLRVHYAEERRE